MIDAPSRVPWGFGLGSRLVGSSDVPRGDVSTACEVCARCLGEGFKSAVLIAGRWVGGDNDYLCHRCRGIGGVSYALFPEQQASLVARLLAGGSR